MCVNYLKKDIFQQTPATHLVQLRKMAQFRAQTETQSEAFALTLVIPATLGEEVLPQDAVSLNICLRHLCMYGRLFESELLRIF